MNLNLLKDKASKGTMKAMKAKERRCFTIIELLVVISIIAILASLLLPALSSVREKGKAIACQSNMKQLAYAWSFYTSDYQEWCPGPFYNGFYSKDRWFLEFRDSRYINEKVTKCPSSNYWEFNARSINYGVPGYVFGFTDYKNRQSKPRIRSSSVRPGPRLFWKACQKADIMKSESAAPIGTETASVISMNIPITMQKRSESTIMSGNTVTVRKISERGISRRTCGQTQLQKFYPPMHRHAGSGLGAHRRTRPVPSQWKLPGINKSRQKNELYKEEKT